MARQEERRTSYRQRAESHRGGFERTSVLIPDGISMFALDKAGVIKVDIVTYRVGEGNPYADPGTLHPERTYWVHKNIGPNEDSYVCLAKTFKEACPVCEYVRAQSKRGGSKDEIAALKELEPKERQLWWVRDLAEPDKGFQLWDISYHLFGKMLDARIKNSDADDGYEYFADLAAGLTMKLGINERSFNGRAFYEVQTIDFRPRAESIDVSFADQLPCLDELIIKTPYDKLKAIFLQTGDVGNGDGGGATGGGDDDWDNPPPPKATAPGAARSTAAAPRTAPPATKPPAGARTAPPTRTAPPPPAPEPDPEPELEEEVAAGDEFDAMDRLALRKYIAANKLDIKVYTNTADDEIRDAIRALVATPEPEPEPEPELEEEPAPPPPARTASKAPAKAPAKATTPAKAPATGKAAPAASKPAAAKPAPAPAAGNDDWDDWDNP